MSPLICFIISFQISSMASPWRVAISRGRVGGGLLGLIFAGYVPMASQSPYPIIVYSVSNYRPHLSHFSANMYSFRDPNLVTFYFYELTHFLDRPKNTLLFIYSTNILIRLLTINMKNCLTPKKS